MRRNAFESRLVSRRRLIGPALAMGLVVLLGGADRPSNLERASTVASEQLQWFARQARSWYRSTPPADRMTWGGLAACGLLGLSVLGERSLRLRKGRVLPTRFVDRFRDRLQDGQLDKGKGTDLCEMNPSPASRIALAAIRRWGRPSPDLERAVSLARQVEADRLRRNVGTLRRIAALAPLVGLLGTLMAAGRALSGLEGAEASAAWGPALGGALAPLTAGVAVAILALVAYDGLMGRVETLENALDRLGAETVDAISVLAATQASRAEKSTSAAAANPHRNASAGPHFGIGGQSRGSQPIRVEIPDSLRNF
ncbi:MotA/TolQ/ExbB proton channel family protein [Tautonia rosea]|uniref:MotA/TolQ/ExbB proton channel family protein n=1 Tax=Tautonia rosea TaxID=2728037 RepID=UPI001472908F|nr:MotA/TolQ/ExbB proton channel family protein [Tautonia rosea]